MKKKLTHFVFDGFFMTHDAEAGTVVTSFEDDTWTGGTIVPEDHEHAEALGITPLEHRLLHEIMHHLVGIAVYKGARSAVLWRAAHKETFPEPDSSLEEWYVTALSYLACGKDPADYGALIDIAKAGASPIRLAQTAKLCLDATRGLGITEVSFLE